MIQLKIIRHNDIRSFCFPHLRRNYKVITYRWYELVNPMTSAFVNVPFRNHSYILCLNLFSRYESFKNCITSYCACTEDLRWKPIQRHSPREQTHDAWLWLDPDVLKLLPVHYFLVGDTHACQTPTCIPPPPRLHLRNLNVPKTLNIEWISFNFKFNRKFICRITVKGTVSQIVKTHFVSSFIT